MFVCILLIVGGSAAHYILDRMAAAEMKKAPVDDDKYFRFATWANFALLTAGAGFVGAVLFFTYTW